ncbi:MAG TPA: hypothetical protein VJ728_15205 [Candidatus Binataceae bacterium]|nr:hypothetical protein [Candidatus Binataceae bacterium]
MHQLRKERLGPALLSMIEETKSDFGKIIERLDLITARLAELHQHATQLTEVANSVIVTGIRSHAQNR